MASDDRTLLRNTDEEWAALARQGTDVERIVSFWSDDAKVYPPGEPLLDGKQAIREFVTGSLKTPGFSVSWEPLEVMVTPGESLGYTTGRNRFTFPHSSGQIVDIWNTAPNS